MKKISYSHRRTGDRSLGRVRGGRARRQPGGCVPRERRASPRAARHATVQAPAESSARCAGTRGRLSEHLRHVPQRHAGGRNCQHSACGGLPRRRDCRSGGARPTWQRAARAAIRRRRPPRRTRGADHHDHAAGADHDDRAAADHHDDRGSTTTTTIAPPDSTTTIKPTDDHGRPTTTTVDRRPPRRWHRTTQSRLQDRPSGQTDRHEGRLRAPFVVAAVLPSRRPLGHQGTRAGTSQWTPRLPHLQLPPRPEPVRDTHRAAAGDRHCSTHRKILLGSSLLLLIMGLTITEERRSAPVGDGNPADPRWWH